MTGELITFTTLMNDLDLTAKAVRRLARKCGISVDPFDRYLTPSERDAIYDEWIQIGGIPRDEMILIDTCSLLMYPGSEIYFRNQASKLLRTGKKIIIPFVVINELRNLTTRKSDLELSSKARNVLNFIREYKEQGIIAIHGEATDGTLADNTFQKVITMFGHLYNIIIITQDYNLGQDLLTMGHMHSSGRRKVNVKKLDNRGQLHVVEWEGLRR